MQILDINKKETSLTAEIFHRLASVPLVGKYSVYQVFADEWVKIASDLEIIQTDGFSAIEGLTDANALELLEQKWIKPLMNAIYRIPNDITSDLTAKVKALADKYATTYADVTTQIRDTKLSLSGLIDNLVGNDCDMKGLAEFKTLLQGDFK